ncbi:histidinol-phosphate transaminase [Archaeoglobus veneficus]|uniref:Histidinol-phosphate aminotransferase n=1 Tax=Archaeoglobus veneficus (strain DSM 11195 / SNP6) TaxID=693661 RepID=F2KSK5_ARCVS|nr:histidinol-phosphate transaminase [Archaeoglobus veneficus]AEA48075.1 Histidinol-phosphate aminotransferase [Archaeoglobus veneficus SNP6]
MIRNVIHLINPYDAGKFPVDVSRLYGIPESQVIQLGSNENPYPPSEEVKKAFHDSISDINQYPHPEYQRLKEAIASYTGTDVERIAIGNGASELLRTICDIVVEPLDRVVIPVPGYTLYAIFAMVRDARIDFIEVPGYAVTAESLGNLSDAKLVFLCSPNNPTGNTIEKKEVEKIVEGCGGIVVLDEAYAEFAGKSCIDLTGRYDNLVVVRSFSKFFGLAGLRVGYAIGNPEIIAAMEKIRLPFGISSVAYRTAIAAVESVEYYEGVKEKIIMERERLAKELKKLGFFVYPSEANFVLVRAKKDVSEELEKSGIIVRNVTGLLGLEGFHIRITVGLPEENDRFLEAIATVSRC